MLILFITTVHDIIRLKSSQDSRVAPFCVCVCVTVTHARTQTRQTFKIDANSTNLSRVEVLYAINEQQSSNHRVLSPSVRLTTTKKKEEDRSRRGKEKRSGEQETFGTTPRDEELTMVHESELSVCMCVYVCVYVCVRIFFILLFFIFFCLS